LCTLKIVYVLRKEATNIQFAESFTRT